MCRYQTEIPALSGDLTQKLGPGRMFLERTDVKMCWGSSETSKVLRTRHRLKHWNPTH